MFTTGANDPRVAPWNMLKMAARVQAATSSGRPVLLRIDYDAGRGLVCVCTGWEETGGGCRSEKRRDLCLS
jgi:protease II